MIEKLNSQSAAPKNRGRLLYSYQVAEILGVAVRTVCLWAEIGILPGFKVGRRMWRFWEQDILDFLNETGPQTNQ